MANSKIIIVEGPQGVGKTKYHTQIFIDYAELKI